MHPYSALTPDVVLDALSSVGLHGDGRLMALSSYENRVYQVQLEDAYQGHASVVAKFYRPQRWSDAQILEEHAFAAQLMAAEVPMVGPLVLAGEQGDSSLHHFDGFAFSVSPKRGGRAPELDDFEVLEWIGRLLARLHTVGAAQPFVYRPALDAASFALEPRDWLLANQMIPLDVQSEWQAAFEIAIECVAVCAGSVWAAGIKGLKIPLNMGHNTVQMIRLHGDSHPGNILWTSADQPNPGPHFVDLDDARTGPAVQDLWMLLSGDRAQRTGQLSALLDGYEQVRNFDRRELALIEPLRTLRLIHYSAWLARRWSDPAFPAAFPWFGSSDYWKGQVLMLQEQVEAMQESPLVV